MAKRSGITPKSDIWSNDEAASIARFLDKKIKSIDEISTVIKKKIEKLLEYKKSLINETVSGDMLATQEQAEAVQ